MENAHPHSGKGAPMEYETVEDRLTPGTWRVEAVGDDGEVYVAIFSGPDAKARADEYCLWKSKVPALA